MTTYFSEKALLLPPTERAAFSDRQAYVCAELSRLAYYKFEGGQSLDEIITFAKSIFAGDPRLAPLEQKLRSILTASPADAIRSEQAFRTILEEGGFTLVKTFCRSGAQGFLCTRAVALEAGGEKTVGFLAFRGTEPRDFRDIKADINHPLIKEAVDGETLEFHRGFVGSLKEVNAEINDEVDDLSADQLSSPVIPWVGPWL